MHHPQGIGDELRDDAAQMRRKARRDWLKHHTACAGVARERARSLRASNNEDAALVFATHAGRHELRAHVLQLNARNKAA